MTDPGPERIVALVPVKDAAEGIAETVTALLGSGVPDEVVVIDDGSSDGTATAAADSGATVLRHDVNRGKGAAVRTGVDHAADATVFLLVDADLREHAATATRLVAEIVEDRAELAIAVFPPAQGRGGAGRVKDLGRRVIRRLGGIEVREPLSGQRAVRADLLRPMSLAPRFGVEVAMTIDAARVGARIVEVELPLDHDHTGGSWAGLVHRAGQGWDILRAAVPRVGPPAARNAAVVLLALLVGLVATLGGAAGRDVGAALPATDAPTVVVLGVPRVSVEDLERGAMPTLAALVGSDRAASASMTVRFPSRPSDLATSFATLSAGAPVAMNEDDDLSEIDEVTGLGPDEEPEDLWPSPPVRLRDPPAGEGSPWQVSTRLEPIAPGEDSRSYGTLGALAGVVRDAGLRTGFVGPRALDGVEQTVVDGVPTALFAADENGEIDVVDGRRAHTVEIAATPEQLDATLVDTAERAAAMAGDVALVAIDSPRFAWPRPEPTTPADAGEEAPAPAPVPREVVEEQRLADLGLADAFLADLIDEVPDGTPIVVMGVTPPGGRWELTPLVLVDGPVTGELSSPATQRSGLVTLTDVAPTVLGLLGLEAPEGMIGAPVTRSAERADLGGLAEIGRRADLRERTYSLAIVPFVVSQALIYGLYLTIGARRPRAARTLEVLAVASAAWPLSTFLLRLLPATWTGPVVTNLLLLVLAIAIGWWASRARYRPLGPLVWVCAATSLLMVVDLATGRTLQESSLIGYSPLTAARFYGLGNMALAVFACTSLVVAGALVTWATRRRDALLAAAAIMAVTLWCVAHPWLGANVGGTITVALVYAVVFANWAGLRFRPRDVTIVVVGALGVLAAYATYHWAVGAESHLTGFLTGSGDDAWATIRRKADTNLRVMRVTTWTWMVPIVVAFLVAAGFPRRNSRVRLGRDGLRATFLGLIAVGVVGGIVNDSGVVLTAMSLIYVGTLLVLVLRRQPYAAPVLVHDAGAAR